MEEIQTLLARIATALEEANRINSDWMTTNMQWHKENEALSAMRYQETVTRENRLVALHEENIQREQAHREQMAQRVNEHYQVAYNTWLKELKHQDKP